MAKKTAAASAQQPQSVKQGLRSGQAECNESDDHGEHDKRDQEGNHDYDDHNKDAKPTISKVGKEKAAAKKRATPKARQESATTKQQAIVSAKRKRDRVITKQPVKGGFVLPHGMGATLGPPFHDGVAVPSPDATNSNTGVSALTNTKTSGEGETGIPGATPADKDSKEDEPPTKRPRKSDTGKEEGKNTGPSKKKAMTERAPALVTIRGVLILEGSAVKVGDDMAVDASGVLRPDIKRLVKRGPDNPYGLSPGVSPYPYRQVPNLEDCKTVYRILSGTHGVCEPPAKMPPASLEVAGCGEVPCVLDALLRTLLSGNTTMALADKAIKNLANHYGVRQRGTGKGSIDWEKVRASSHEELAEVIKIAGGGPKRSRFIKAILDMVYEENIAKLKEADKVASDTTNLLTLDHMHSMTKDEALAKFVTYPGIGIKTAACVTLFCLQIPCFAVDTHVHRFSIWLGWVPANADPDTTFRHGDVMVPDHLKYGLHQLFIRHGQVCFKCRKATRPGTKDWEEAEDCPLEHLLNRAKKEVAELNLKNIRNKSDYDADGEKGNAEDNTDNEDDSEYAEAKSKAKRSRKSHAKAVKVAAKEEFDTEMEDSETEAASTEDNSGKDTKEIARKVRVPSKDSVKRKPEKRMGGSQTTVDACASPNTVGNVRMTRSRTSKDVAKVPVESSADEDSDTDMEETDTESENSEDDSDTDSEEEAAKRRKIRAGKAKASVATPAGGFGEDRW